MRGSLRRFYGEQRPVIRGQRTVRICPVVRRSHAIAIVVMCLFICPVALRADSFQIESLPLAFPRGSTFISSRSGSAVVVVSPSGDARLVANAFQYDQQQYDLPKDFSGATVLAVSYYGDVFAWKSGGSGCELLHYSLQSGSPTEIPEATTVRRMVGFSKECTLGRGATNVGNFLAVELRDGEREQLLLVIEDEVRVVWDNQGAGDARLESVTINDLNTLGYTVSSTTDGRRAYSSYFWVPARDVQPIEIPKKAGTRVVVQDVNNRNHYLLSTSKGSFLLDPSRRRVFKLNGKGTSLSPSGRPYSPKALYATNDETLSMACLARKRFRGATLSLLAVDEERDLIVSVVSKGGVVQLARAIPLTPRGFPSC